MFLKTHISGDAIVYSSGSKKKKDEDNEPLLFADDKPSTDGRPQGSLYNQQKRKIADACEWLRLHNNKNPERCALVFCLTTPGYTLEANEPKFISRWLDNMKANYGLGEYVWVRELTKKGYPHFHFVADWWRAPWWFASDINSRLSNVHCVSLTWSAHFGSNAKESIRLGGYWYGKRLYELKSKTQCRYLTKYLGKTLTPPPPAMVKPMNGIDFNRIKSHANRAPFQSVINLL